MYGRSVYPFFCSVASAETLCVPGPIFMGTAVKKLSRSLSSWCWYSSSSQCCLGRWCEWWVVSAVLMAWSPYLWRPDKLSFKSGHHMGITICAGQHLGTLKSFVLTANFTCKLVTKCFSYFSFSMLEPCFLRNQSKFLSCRETWWMGRMSHCDFKGGEWEGINGQSLSWQLGMNRWRSSSAHSEVESTGSWFPVHRLSFICDREFLLIPEDPTQLSSVVPFWASPGRASHSSEVCPRGCQTAHYVAHSYWLS